MYVIYNIYIIMHYYDHKRYILYTYISYIYIYALDVFSKKLY